MATSTVTEVYGNSGREMGFRMKRMAVSEYDGAMQPIPGRISTVTGTCFDENSYMVTGWYWSGEDGIIWRTNGQMQTGWFTTDGEEVLFGSGYRCHGTEYNHRRS